MKVVCLCLGKASSVQLVVPGTRCSSVYVEKLIYRTHQKQSIEFKYMVLGLLFLKHSICFTFSAFH